jgi:hypothetical protein
MALTQITTQVVAANAITAPTIANSAIETRHIGTAQITQDKMAANVGVGVWATVGALANVTNNVGAVLANLNSYATVTNTSLNTIQTNVYSVSGGLTGANVRIAGAESNVIALQGGLSGSNTRLSGAESNVIALQGGLTGANTINTNQTTGLTGANTRIAGAESNVIALQGGLTGANTINTNQTTGLNGANTNITNLTTGLTGSNTRISGAESNVITLQSFATGTQSNVASIINGTTQFTGNITVQRNLTVQGNLYVTGAQVDLGVGSTSIYDSIITLNGNLSSSSPPPADTGFLINRGSSDNVFIGIEVGETSDPHIHFSYTNSPGTNTIIAVKSYIDIHANAYHAELSSLGQAAFAMHNDLTTGIHFPSTGIVSITSNGVMMANVTPSGNLELTTGYIQTPGTAFNSLDLRTTSMSNGVSLRSVTSVGVLLDHNNNGTNDWFGVFTNTDDPSSSVDTAIFSIREQNSNVYSKGSLNYISSNATTDVYSGNAVISTRIYSSGVELRSNDYATYLVVSGGLTGSNTRISGAESNVIALQSGLTGANTNITNLTTGLTGSNTNITNLTTGLTGSNTRISGAESNVIALQGGLSGANANIYSTYLAATSNDFVTYTRLNANLNTVSSNTDGKLSLTGGTMSGNIAMGAKHINNLADPVQGQDAATRAYVLAVAGGTTIAPAYTTNVSSGTSNAIVLTINTPLSISRTVVSLAGVFQTPTVDYVLNTGNNSIQYTVGSLPAGLTTVIQSWA